MRVRVLSAIAIWIALPACAANDVDTPPPGGATVPAAAASDVTTTVAAELATARPSVVDISESGGTTVAAAASNVTTTLAAELSTALPAIDLGAPSWSAVYGFGAVWIQVDPPLDQVVKVDEASGSVTLTIDAGRSAAIAEDGVWVTVGGQETRKINPVTGEVIVSTPTPGANYVTFGAGAVWVPSGGGVSRLDPVTGAITAEIALDLEATDLEASNDAVWVTHKKQGKVSRIDPLTNTVIATIETGAGAHDLAIDGNGVWITNYTANTVSRIDPATNTVVATIEGVGSGVGITIGGGAIFVSTRAGDISRIDPATNESRPVVELRGWHYGLAYGDGELWATDVDNGVVYRLNDALLAPGGG